MGVLQNDRLLLLHLQEQMEMELNILLSISILLIISVKKGGKQHNYSYIFWIHYLFNHWVLIITFIWMRFLQKLRTAVDLHIIWGSLSHDKEFILLSHYDKDHFFEIIFKWLASCWLSVLLWTANASGNWWMMWYLLTFDLCKIQKI